MGIEDLSQIKGCLATEHSNTNIALICIDKNCKEQSRTLCQECIIQRSHSECKNFIMFENNNKIKRDIEPDSKIQELKDRI